MSPRRLSAATLGELRRGVERPAYDRGRVRPGVVHFGPGAFHRAHQACYFDDVLRHDPAFGVVAVSLRTPDLARALGPQDGLYAVAEREAAPGWRVVGALTAALTAVQDPEAVFARLVSSELRLVTATVTEKGYCLDAAGALDLDHPDIRHDLRHPERPRSLAGWIVEAAGRRQAAGLPPMAVASCDNLSGNGGKLRAACVALARARDEPALASRLESRTAFPDTMVDSITPATDDALRAAALEALGLADAWPVQRERFRQWVVQDTVGPAAEALAGAGVTIARDVAAFERAKLRLLNGAHTTLAYVGLGLGYATVAEAMGDARLAGFVERLMREDAAATVAAPELDLTAYVTDILARFRNPAIEHRLSQIAWDGSQKLRFRLLETLADLADQGRPLDRPAVGVAAWIRFVRCEVEAGRPLTDPLADALGRLVRMGGEADDPARFLEMEAVFPARLAGHPGIREAIARAHAGLARAPDVVLAL